MESVTFEHQANSSNSWLIPAIVVPTVVAVGVAAIATVGGVILYKHGRFGKKSLDATTTTAYSTKTQAVEMVLASAVPVYSSVAGAQLASAVPVYPELTGTQYVGMVAEMP